MESTASIEHFQGELQAWKQQLSAFKQEIRHFENQLENLAAKNLPKDVLAQVEHFQNMFICHKEVIDNLRHDIPDSRHKLESIFNGHQREPLDKLAKHALQERMDMFRRVYEEVREEFHQFEAEWM